MRLARELVTSCRALNRQVAELDQQLEQRVKETAPRLLELPGCAADGATYREALDNAESVMDVLRDAAPQAPAPDGLRAALRNLPILKVSGEALSETLAETTGVVGADLFFCDWDEQEWFVSLASVEAIIEAAVSH